MSQWPRRKPIEVEAPMSDQSAARSSDPLAELCARCGFTYYNHESNTGVPYPCWTPTGKYSVDKKTNAPRPASAPPPLSRETCPTCGKVAEDWGICSDSSHRSSPVPAPDSNSSTTRDEPRRVNDKNHAPASNPLPLRRITSETTIGAMRGVPALVVETLACGHVYLRDTWARSAKSRRCRPCLHWQDLQEGSA